MYEVKKESTIAEVLAQDTDTAAIFTSYGLHCLGCPMSRMESIADAGTVHGVDVDALISALNEHFQAAAQ